MYLTKHKTQSGTSWAADDNFLAADFSFKTLLQLPKNEIAGYIESRLTLEPAGGNLLAPIEPEQEVWASGVTYYRSRDAREAETDIKNIYTKVYRAERPELFFKALGWRVAGHMNPIRIRKDSSWNVPEPELTIVANCRGEIVGYCVGNDVSSRDIEGANPLYLPQAKVYDGSCALGPGVRIVDPETLRDLPIRIEIYRDREIIYADQIRTSQISRPLESLISCLMKEMSFPHGVFLMTGTGIVPPGDFTLHAGDRVRIDIDSFVLENAVAAPDVQSTRQP
jgi:2-dehydro-3-deoxy-D-arabinonate dehydratase